MIKIKVIAIGKCKEAWLQMALAEYEKRLSPFLKIIWMIPQNTIQMEEMASGEEFYILLDPNGEKFDSFHFSQKFNTLLEKTGSRITFLIGGPDGFSPKLIQRASLKWSLSPLTFTHQMTRLILIEQIYRAMEIRRGSPYHK